MCPDNVQLAFASLEYENVVALSRIRVLLLVELLLRTSILLGLPLSIWFSKT